MTVELHIGGRVFGGWETARVTRGVKRGASDFELKATERWPGQDTPVGVRPGDLCQIFVEGERFVTGYLDDVSPEFDSGNHVVSFSGRSLTADLIDCSAMNKPGQWRGLGLGAIARAIAAPFGVEVLVKANEGKAFPDFQIQQGDTAFAAIERMAHMRALMVSDDELGRLVIWSVGTERATVSIRNLAGGADNNVTKGSATYSHRERYSQYTIRGQAAGTDEWNATDAAEAQAVATDKNVTRYRPLLVVAEGQTDNAVAHDRARWERSTRAGASVALTYTVPGWRQTQGGPLWRPNMVVNVRDDYLKYYGDLVVAEVTFSMSENESTTTLSLGPAEAFEPREQDKAGTGANYWPEIQGGV